VASVYNRGTKAQPRWYSKTKDAAGIWRSKATRQQNRRDALKVALAEEAKSERQRAGLERAAVPDPLMGELLERWSLGLVNRSSLHDRARAQRHLLPKWGSARLSAVDLRAVLGWLDEMRTAGKLAAGSQRHCLNLLSRFFSWAIERQVAQVNPCRSVPQGRRPVVVQRRDVPWIEDDGQVSALMLALPAPFDQMFYLGNRSGLRTGEVCGLRLADLGELGEGAVRVRFSYDGPLKEDKRGEGRCKWAPAADDAQAVLGAWLARRQNEGAGAEDYVFPRPGGGHWRKEDVFYRWRVARAAVGLSLSYYQGTRHSFASRLLAAGVPIDAVSAALGHSSVIVTKRHYDHVLRRTFAATMRQGLQARG
jgi:integrase